MSAKSPTETSSETIPTAPPAAPTMGHKFHCRRVTPSASSPNNTCLSGSARRSTPSSTPKASHQDVTWHKKLLKVKVLEEKYADQYSPRMDEDGIIHSGKVMIPKIDLSKIKPHVLRSLPKPGIYPLHGCSPDPDFFNKCIDGGQRTKFECLLPFGKKPAFDTNLGLVAVPKEPIGGFVYKSGSLESTVWQLHAEPLYI